MEFFHCFETRGFRDYSLSSKSMNLVGDYEEASFYNPDKSRKLIVSYVESEGSKSEVLSVHIENENGESFEVKEFLKSKGKPDSQINDIQIKNYQGELDIRLENCLKSILKIIEHDLESIVFGKEWKTVSVDWASYK